MLAADTLGSLGDDWKTVRSKELSRRWRFSSGFSHNPCGLLLLYDFRG